MRQSRSNGTVDVGVGFGVSVDVRVNVGVRGIVVVVVSPVGFWLIECVLAACSVRVVSVADRAFSLGARYRRGGRCQRVQNVRKDVLIDVCGP